MLCSCCWNLGELHITACLPALLVSLQAQMYLDMWDFPNTYTMGKNLTEKLVASYYKQHRLPIAIVRPTLVCGLAGNPYPGYCGNLAGKPQLLISTLLMQGYLYVAWVASLRHQLWCPSCMLGI